ncbi:MAG: hypothetical protein HGJ93_00690 [Desulfosarcina sp.]|nr:hypothetical protein [Desulfosarcina sp.]MBC2764503.1 hypothetical protein [Desulfosarcina sp.]
MAETWDETKPAGTRNPKLGDDDIREFKTAVRERQAAEHHWEPIEGTPFGDPGSQIGFHKKVTLIEQATDPVTQADEMAVYCKNVDGHPELFVRPESDGTVVQLTRKQGVLSNPAVFLPEQAAAPSTVAGEVAIYTKDVSGQIELFVRDESNGTEHRLTWSLGPSIPSGETILFEKDTAVVGYTLLTNIDDYGVYITKGSAAGGQVGGAAKTGGTWAQPTHVHGAGTYAVGSHNHKWLEANGDGAHDDTYDASGNAVDLPVYVKAPNSTNYRFLSYGVVSHDNAGYGVNDAWTNNDTPSFGGISGAGATANTWRYPGINFTRQQRN